MGDNFDSFSVSDDTLRADEALSLGFTKGRLTLPPIVMLGLIIFTKVLIYADRGIMAAVMPLLTSQGIEMSNLEAGLIGSIFIVGVLISTPWSAHLSKSYHPFSMVAVGQIIWTASIAFTCLFQNYWVLLAGRALTGLSEGAYLTVISPCVLEIAPAKSKTVWYSIFSSSIPIGMSVGYMFGSSVGSDYGWRTAFAIEAVLMVLPTVCFILLYRDPKLKLAKQTDPLSPDSVSFKDELRSLAKNRVYVCMVAGLSFLFFTTVGLGYWIPYIFKFQYAVDPKKTGLITGLVILIGGTFGALIGSVYQDYKLNPYTKQHENAQISDEELSSIRSTISLRLCRATAFCAAVVLMVGALSNDLTFFVVCYSIGTFVSMLNIGSFGVALMSCVDRSLRNHSIAVALFTSQLLGGFPSSFVMGVLIQLMDLYWAVVILMSFMAPCCICWNMAYKASKQALSGALLK